MKAWLFRDSRQKAKLGDKCPWSVGWIDPDGKKRSKKIGCRSLAERFARKIEGQLAAGTYQTAERVAWEKFRAEWEAKIGAGMEPQSCQCTLGALRHFERIVKPKLVKAVKTQTIDEYVAKRRTEPGVKKGTKVSPATINKELRHIKAVLRVACDWGYMAKPPKVRMVKEPQKIKAYVTPDHLGMIYGAADVAKRPESPDYTAGDWWRALIIYAYMTGWRVRQIVNSLRWNDVSLDRATAITRHTDNKAKRDRQTPLHPLVVEHLRKLADASVGTGPSAGLVFWWPHNEHTLWLDFYRIQLAGGIPTTCGLQEIPYSKPRKKPKRPAPTPHRHSTDCGLYGFHALRRAFATENFDRMTAEELQAMMQHSSYTTTQRYISMARQLKATAEKVFVPTLTPVFRDADCVSVECRTRAERRESS